MEINNGFAEKRLFLEGRSEQFKAAAKGEVKEFKGNVSKIGNTALIVGSGVLATYFIYKMFFGNSKTKTIVRPKEYNCPENTVVVQRVEEESTIVKRIKEQIALFLISIAKQKLQEYIDGLGKKTND
jgi:hypothetical protein